MTSKVTSCFHTGCGCGPSVRAASAGVTVLARLRPASPASERGWATPLASSPYSSMGSRPMNSFLSNCTTAYGRAAGLLTAKLRPATILMVR